MNNKGFTLIEVLAAFVLLGILATFATVSVIDYLDAADESADMIDTLSDFEHIAVSWFFAGKKALQVIPLIREALERQNAMQMFGLLIKEGGVLYYDPQYDYSYVIEYMPSTWTAVPLTM